MDRDLAHSASLLILTATSQKTVRYVDITWVVVTSQNPKSQGAIYSCRTVRNHLCLFVIDGDQTQCHNEKCKLARAAFMNSASSTASFSCDHIANKRKQFPPDRYSISIFRENEDWRSEKPLERFDRQPLPDYQRWKESGELHYLSYVARHDSPRGPWDECPGLFLPEKILESAFRVLPSPLEELKAIAHLAWITVNNVSQFYAKAQKQLRQQKEDLKCKAWKLHPLYKENNTGTLIDRIGGCLNPNLKKYELVEQIVERSGEAEKFVSMLSEEDLYDGNLSSIPSSTTGLLKLSVVHLRAILRAHDVLEVGSKEELIARVGLFKAGHQEAPFDVNVYPFSIKLKQPGNFYKTRSRILASFVKVHLLMAKQKH